MVVTVGIFHTGSLDRVVDVVFLGAILLSSYFSISDDRYGVSG